MSRYHAEEGLNPRGGPLLLYRRHPDHCAGQVANDAIIFAFVRDLVKAGAVLGDGCFIAEEAAGGRRAGGQAAAVSRRRGEVPGAGGGVRPAGQEAEAGGSQVAQEGYQGDVQGVEVMNGEVESVSTSVGVDRTGCVSRPVSDTRESPSALRRERVVSLRGRCAHAHLPCCDNGDVKVVPGAPVPPTVPGDFVVYLGADDVPDRLDRGLASLLLTWIDWVEVEVRGFDDGLVEGLHLLRGAVMSVAAAVAGEL